MRIDFHKWKTFKECPKKFLMQYIRRAPSTVPVEDYYKLYGLLVQRFFELYCNIWRFRTPYLFPEIIKERLEKLYQDLLSSSTVDWNNKKASQEGIFSQAYSSICAIMDSMNQNYFLNTKSEVTIEIKTKDDNIINGRIDFIHYMPLAKDDFIIMDGKGTDKLGKNIDEDQLLFYTLLTYFKYNRLPSQAGFFYYRFNTFNPIPIDMGRLNKFRAGLSLDIKTMTATPEYNASPSTKACRYCLYRDKCDERQKAVKHKKSKIELEGDGIVSFGF